MTLSELELKKFETRLRDEEKKLRAEINNTSSNADFGDDIDGLDEESDEAEEFGNMLSVKTEMTDHLENVENALEKIKEGLYGICEACGSEISKDVLEASPESKLCKACKQKE